MSLYRSWSKYNCQLFKVSGSAILETPVTIQTLKLSCIGLECSWELQVCCWHGLGDRLCTKETRLLTTCPLKLVPYDKKMTSGTPNNWSPNSSYPSRGSGSCLWLREHYSGSNIEQSFGWVRLGLFPTWSGCYKASTSAAYGRKLVGQC